MFPKTQQEARKGNAKSVVMHGPSFLNVLLKETQMTMMYCSRVLGIFVVL